jgi:S1-C subfamily serine protease
VAQAESIDIGFEVHEHPGNELHVSGLLEGSDAEAKGITIGDIVRRVNGEEVIRKTMFDTSLRLVRPGDTVNFRISPINFKEPDRDVHVLSTSLCSLMRP